jgi:hypothetical protein
VTFVDWRLWSVVRPHDRRGTHRDERHELGDCRDASSLLAKPIG